jgi:hypothetical protein
LRVLEQPEQLLRGFGIEDSAEAVVLDHRLCSRTEMTEICQTDAIDAGGQPAFPASPDEARGVEQERGVVGQVVLLPNEGPCGKALAPPLALVAAELG